MDNADISDIALEQIIFEAVNRNQASLDLLMASRWMMSLLNKIAAWASGRFNVDANDVRDAISDKLRRKIHKVKKPNKNSLKSWCYTAARNYCKNASRHNGVVTRHNDRVIHENTQGTRRSAGGHAKPLPLRTANSPEDILLERDEALLWQQRGALLRAQVQEILAKLSPGDLEIAICWARGMNLRETAAATGRSLPTVQRRLKEKVQKEIIEKIGIKQILADDPKLEAGAYELITNSLRTLISRGNSLPTLAV